MSGEWKDLTFARKYHVSARLRDYKLVHPGKKIDHGRIHKDYSEEYGGQKEWIERPADISLGIPIDSPDLMPKYDESQSSQNYTEVLRDEINVDYPSILVFPQKPEKLDTDIAFLETNAEKRELKAGTGCFLTAAVWYGTHSTETIDAFVVILYHAYKQYKKVPQQWTPLLSPTGEKAMLKYLPVQPNTRVFPPTENACFWWDKVPKDGYLIARITDTRGTYNPIPTDIILPDSWFEAHAQWAFIPITE